MGSPVVGARPPSHVAYYVAMAGVAVLLIMLCCYFLYFFISKVKELSTQDPLIPYVSSPRPSPSPAPYPVQPVVRDTATVMAKLCKQMPQQPAAKGDTVFPTSTSPEAQQTDTGSNAGTVPAPEKIPVHVTAQPSGDYQTLAAR